MSKNMNNTEQTHRDDETLARLLQLAGRSEPIAADVEDRVYRAVRREWLASTSQPDSKRVYSTVRREWNKTPARRSRIRRWAMPLAMAASAVLALTIVLQPEAPVTTPVSIGTVAKTVGQANGNFAVGSEVFVGDRLTTGAGGGMSVRLAGAESVRLDENTTLVIGAGNQFELVAGRVYADTGNLIRRDQGLVIDTAIGTVTDVGTQFSVAVSASLLDVAVREGRVDVLNEDREFVAVAGERMRVQSGQNAKFESLPPHDEYWDWVASLAPAYDIEDRSLLDFLRWASRESGLELDFEDNELRMAAMRTDLHGSIQDLEPTEAIGAVLSTTTFKYRFDGNQLVIYRD
jgi:ferric-dicitrate binding protein FerR (iron transport regulator)